MKQYTLPTATDPEGQTVATTLVFSPALTFLTLQTNVLTISPTALSHIGLWTVTISLSDGYASSSYSFNITVTNTAPAFNSATPKDQTVRQNQSISYVLPVYSDKEMQTVTIQHSKLPNFVIFDQNFYTISPSATQALGLYQVSGTLSDGNLATTFSFNIAVL